METTHATRSGSNTDVSSVEVLNDGLPVGKRIELDFTAKQYALAYMWLALSTGKAFADESNGITYRKYVDGFTLYGFDFTPNQNDGGGAHLIRTSTLVINVTFKTALVRTVNLVAYCEYDDLVQIDNLNGVSFIGGAP